jgi:hypothetical protein
MVTEFRLFFKPPISVGSRLDSVLYLSTDTTKAQTPCQLNSLSAALEEKNGSVIAMSGSDIGLPFLH